MIKGVILDMDGLLIDSEPYWREALINVMKGVGIELTPERARLTMGLRTEEIVEYWYQVEPWAHKATGEVAEEIVTESLRLILEKAAVMPGVHELINFVKQEGLRLGLASSSPMNMIKAIVPKIGIENELEVLRSGDQEKLAKPHPDVFIHAAEELGLRPNECLVFEDSFNGLLAAKAAKMKAVVVPEDYDDPRFVIADLKLRSLEEFTAIHFEELNQ
ncbi:hexitol phosphatase HxpB [Limibacter armeniacum]|uniref:hexitol phosphatase HxpB n=1 Tax=Limibacter armeniacum TaxID=466084 RepID=UPI002FE6A1CF